MTTHRRPVRLVISLVLCAATRVWSSAATDTFTGTTGAVKGIVTGSIPMLLRPIESKNDLSTLASYVNEMWELHNRLTMSLEMRLNPYQPRPAPVTTGGFSSWLPPIAIMRSRVLPLGTRWDR